MQGSGVEEISQFCLSVFIFERERERRGGAERERGIERIPSMLCTESTEPNAQTHELGDHGLRQNQELDAQLTEPPRHPKEISYFMMRNAF